MNGLTPEQTLAYVVALMLVLWLMRDAVLNPGYRCPACGTSNPREHSKDCAWSKHYGDDL